MVRQWQHGYVLLLIAREGGRHCSAKLAINLYAWLCHAFLVYLFFYLYNSTCKADTTAKYAFPIDGGLRFSRQFFYAGKENF